MKLQITILVVIILAFIMLFVFTQRSSLSNIKSFVTEPTISLPPDQFNAIPSPTPLSAQEQAYLGQQALVQQMQQETQAQASLSALIKTSKGDIVIVLDRDTAPYSTANFWSKVKAGFYNGLTFHRIEDWVIQGGDPLGNGTGGGTAQTELTSAPFSAGAVGYAASDAMEVGQGARISNDSQFFIVKVDSNHLNGKYAKFGQVTEGMDVVESMQIGDKILGVTIQ